MKPISLDVFDVFLVYTISIFKFSKVRFFPTYYQRKKPTLNVIKDFLTRSFAGIKGLTECMNLPVPVLLFWITHYEI